MVYFKRIIFLLLTALVFGVGLIVGALFTLLCPLIAVFEFVITGDINKSISFLFETLPNYLKSVTEKAKEKLLY